MYKLIRNTIKKARAYISKSIARRRLDPSLFRLLEVKAMHPFQLVGEILARAQLVEELMRVYIAYASPQITNPRNVQGTFGNLRHKFQELYPDGATLLEDLESANESRNHVAHDFFLVNMFIRDLLSGDHDGATIDRFNHKALEKDSVQGRSRAL